MTVAGDDGPEVFDAAVAGGGQREMIGEVADAFGFVAGHEEHLADVEIGDGLGELKAELLVVQAGFGEVLAGFEGADGVVAADGFLDGGFFGVFGGFVVEELDAPAEIGAAFVEVLDFEAAKADGFQVQAAIVVGFDDFVDAGCAADRGDAFFEGEHDAEFAGGVEQIGDHVFVTVLKDMERQIGARKQHDAEWEQRE